ncbi:hypothetical protein GCM10011391_01060 [Pullulanibacillus camelliae]|uniref:VanZ-like domain-containing protein n=1 Tax=Pullulanibacillus camelliae TaxID=1707096 RepID=A0A8J2VKA1_9BACL|nr:VanZ family protein [Pullulanibacillus camelliae]GGE26529.1 hypothetical protein GCM10011391_01060 [Pullulanibacillus camelliae]
MLKNKWGLFSFFILFGFALFIFKASNTPYKDQDMKPLLRKTIHLQADSLPHLSFHYDGEQVTSTKPYAFIEFILRKLGHVAEYAGFTLLVAFFLRQWRMKSGWLRIGNVLIPLLYALSDEWHQSFIPGRTGHLIDVYSFDLFGIILALIGVKCWRRRPMKKDRHLSLKKS